MSASKVVSMDSDESYSDEEDCEESNGENSDSEIIKGTSETFDLSKAARNRLREIYDILEMRQDVNYRNALEMNQEMLKRLLAVREQITILQAKVTERYAANEVFLKQNVKVKKYSDGIFGKINRGDKFYFKGSIFFKDENKRSAPNNNDYLQRQRKGEMFPMDFEMTSRHVWSITDKMSIIKGIKEQIYEDKRLRKRFKNKNKKLGVMLEEINGTFEIDWNQISVHNLRHRHTPSSCKAMFEVYLNPALKHDQFTTEENQVLAQAAEKYNLQNWAAIAAEVGQRSDYQCFLHYQTTPSFRQPYERWDKSDDDLLIKTCEASKCNGIVNWAQVLHIFPHKSRTSLQQRYHYFLNPAISHDPFTGEEDLLLLAAVQEYGTNFSKFPRSLFPNRSVVQLRSRYYNTLATRHKACPWTIEDDKILLKFVDDHGMVWKKCSEFMEHRHTRVSCRQRYMVIQKHMKGNPDFKLEEMSRRPFRMISSCVTPANWLNKIEELRANPQLSVADTTAPIKRGRPRKQPASSARLLKPTETAEPPRKRLKETKKVIYVERLRQCGLLYHNFFKYAYNFRFGKPTQYTPIELYTNESQQAIGRLGFHMPLNCESPLFRRPQLGSNINGLFMPLQRRIDLTSMIRQRVPDGMVLEPDGNQLAPNFSTLTALRALCVLSADTLKQREKKVQTEESKESNKAEGEPEGKSIIKVEVGNKGDDVTNAQEAASTSSLVSKKTLSAEEFNRVPAVNRFRQRFRALFYQATGISRLPPSSIPNENFAKNNLSLHNAPGITATSTVSKTAAVSVTTTTVPIVKLEPELEVSDNSPFSVVVVKEEKDLENVENH